MPVPLAEAVVNVIQNAPGIPAGSVFYLEDDDKLATAILVTPYQGYREPEVPIFHQHFQIAARARSYMDAEKYAWRAFRAIDGTTPADSCEIVLGMPDPIQQPSYLGRDEGGRHTFVFNVRYPVCRPAI